MSIAVAELDASATYGSAQPRLAPPPPLRHDLAGYRETAAELGIIPMPWQDCAACYLTALDADDLWLYREVAVVVGRQNGKTTLTKPLIMRRLKAGRHIMHIAQVRDLPRTMFEELADAVEEHDPGLFPRRRGKIIWPRRGAGSESIVLTNGGSYRISAANGSARGREEIDDLLIDELREMEDFGVINAAKPAQRFSKNPQTIYLSNMGTESSVILNSLRLRSGFVQDGDTASEPDPSLAYLEWSADPVYPTGDMRGWLQSNPSIGHYPQVLRDLEKDYVAAKLAGNLSGFETEALCRKVPSVRERLVDEFAWAKLEAETLPPGRRIYMGVAMDPSGKRAAAALAWQTAEGMATQLIYDVTGSPIDTARLGKDLQLDATKRGVRAVGYDPLTDGELAKFFTKSERITGTRWSNASATFVNLVETGKLRWKDCAAVTEDLKWTARKENEERGSFQAVRADDDRPIPAVLAVIRAVEMASGPRPARPRIY